MQEYIYSLIVKEQTEGLSEEEGELLYSWLQQNTTHKEAYRQATALLDDCRLVGLYEGIDVAHAWTKVASAISTDEVKGIKRSSWRRWIPYVAAAAMLVFSIGVWQYRHKMKERTQAESAIADIDPGGNRAYLTTESGQQISLSAGQSTLVIGDEINYADGSLVEGVPNDISTIQNLQLVVPRGGTYQVILADGTKIWLNSGSKLRYPSRFEGAARVVELEGEGYFEVSKSYIKVNGNKERQPFIVKTSRQNIEVLGTQFNISDYAESATKTTLLEGSIAIAVAQQKKILQPGQQATTFHDELAINKVNVSQVNAWKDGYFDFTDMQLEEVMNQLARWYDIDVTYEGKIPAITFYGTIERDNQLSTVLALLETNNLGYRLQNKKLTIFYNSFKEEKPKK